MKDIIVVDGIRYKRYNKSYPKTIMGTLFEFTARDSGHLEITTDKGKGQTFNINESIPILRELLEYMEEPK